MKLSTTLDQLLRLVIVPDEESPEEEKRRNPADPVSVPVDAAGAEEEVASDEPWRPKYTPPEPFPDEPPVRPWEARFTPEEPDDAAPAAPEPEPEPVAERQPVDPMPARPWEAQFISEEPVEPTYEPTPTYQEPEPVHHEPVAPEPDPWHARFTPPEPFTTEPQPDPEPEPVLPPQPAATPEAPQTAAALEHTPAGERSRLEQLEAAVTVAESLNLGLHLGLAVERIAMAATQGSEGAGPLREAAWLIERYIALLEKRPIGADLHQASARLARTGDAIQDMRQLASSFQSDPDPDEPGRIRRLSD